MPRLTPALMRAIDILELFLEGGQLTANELVERTGLPRTSVHELVTTLVHRGYLDREPTGHFRLGYQTVVLGNAYASRFDILAAASDTARDVATATGETCSVAMPEGREIFYLAKVDGRDVMPLISSVGKRVPAHCTGLGKAMLSLLPDDEVDRLYPEGPLPALSPHTVTDPAELKRQLAVARERGYAVEREESGPNVACAAAPVRGAMGQVVASASISVPLARWDQFGEEHWARIAIDAAARISTQLGFAGAPSLDSKA